MSDKLESIKLNIDRATTKLFADNIVVVASGGECAEVKPDGILTHPRLKYPTVVESDVYGKFSWIVLQAGIGSLPKGALAREKFGTAGIHIEVDDRNIGPRELNRHFNQSVDLNLTKAKSLRISVDSPENSDSYDRCMVGIK